MRRSVLPLFLSLAYDYDDWLKALDVGTWDEGAYSYRKARGADAYSNHASGTALDLNWSKEGAQGSAAGAAFFAVPANKAKVEWLQELYPVLTWGGTWNARDYMHWEISPGKTQKDVDNLIEFLDIGPKGVRHNNHKGQPLRDDRDGRIG